MMRRSEEETREPYSNRIVRRIVSLPRSILGEFSRAVDHGVDQLIAIGGGARRNQQQQSFPFPYPSSFPIHHDHNTFPFQYPQEPHIQEEWAFLNSFERQYGTEHPFFYACKFVDALKMGENEHKFVFVYLHAPDHPFTSYFCRETLCSELVVQFLDANFICWGALVSRGEGLHLATTLRASSFPFCAIVAPASGQSMALLRQIDGPVSPAELVDILQKTMEEQGLAFGSSRGNQEEEEAIAKRREDQRLREEQDAAYMQALRIDQEKEKPRSSNQEHQSRSKSEKLKQVSSSKQHSKLKETNNPKGQMLQKENARGKNLPVTQILIRFPNGERREHTFLCADKIQAIFKYIDSLGLPGIGNNYRLISNFPRKVYGVDQMEMTLKDAALYPKASLFIEFL